MQTSIKDRMQREITEKVPILDDNGHVLNSGWARDDLFLYDRSKIAVNKLRIKEWDFWEIFNDQYRVILNIFDIGYAGVAQFTFTDFKTKQSVNAAMFRLFPRGKVGNPLSWKYEEPLLFTKGQNRMEFSREGNILLLKVEFPKKKISGEFRLEKAPNLDSMVNLIPFSNPKQFVYAVKIMCMPAHGTLQLRDQEYVFSPENRSWGILDWTRAVFPYKNHWKWCTSSGTVQGKPLGFNIDYGFGTESDKSMIIYDGIGHHLGKVHYQHDPKNLTAPLSIRDDDGRVDLVLTPIFIEKAGTDILILKMKGINTYGYFTGNLVLDDGTKITIAESDKLFGWAEEYSQKW